MKPKQKEMKATMESNDIEIVVQQRRLEIMDIVKPMALRLRYTANALSSATVEDV